jgi:hypothetical protein
VDTWCNAGTSAVRDAPDTLDVGVSLKTLGKKMETNLNPPWSYLNLPTNSLRKAVLQHTFLSKAVRDFVNVPTGVWEIVINGLQSRHGYGLEADRQVPATMEPILLSAG